LLVLSTSKYPICLLYPCWCCSPTSSLSVTTTVYTITKLTPLRSHALIGVPTNKKLTPLCPCLCCSPASKRSYPHQLCRPCWCCSPKNYFFFIHILSSFRPLKIMYSMFHPSNKLKMSSKKSSIRIHVGHKTNMGGADRVILGPRIRCPCTLACVFHHEDTDASMPLLVLPTKKGSNCLFYIYFI
jgi:hypothetical protein